MRGFLPKCALLATVFAGLAATATLPALADDNDLVLSRLGTVVTDSQGMAIDVAGDDQAYRSLASELGVVFAPRLVEPADTLGFGGFQFTADVAFSSISSGEDYWRGLESSPDPFGTNVSHGSGTLTTIGVFARKGIWLPVPSFELGLGAVKLAGSKMWAAQGYAKFALHEGFHEFPLPSLAVRGGVSRVMGTNQIDLTIVSIDATVSKSFGVGGTINLAPYAGWNWLIIVPRSEVIDKTPHVDVTFMPEDANLNFTFRDQDDIIRNRFFAGLKMHYYVFTASVEGNFALAGGSVNDRSGTDTPCDDVTSVTEACDADDKAQAQSTFTVSLGVDF